MIVRRINPCKSRRMPRRKASCASCVTRETRDHRPRVTQESKRHGAATCRFSILTIAGIRKSSPRQVALVQSDPDPETVFCVTKTRVEMEGGWIRVRPERAVAAGEPWSEFIYVNDGFAQTNSFFLSREMALKIPFRTRVRQHEDNLFFFDAEALGARYRLINEPLSIWNQDSAKRSAQASRSCLRPQLIHEAGPLLTEKARLASRGDLSRPLKLRKALPARSGCFCAH